MKTVVLSHALTLEIVKR